MSSPHQRILRSARWRSWTYSLEDYATAFEQVTLRIETIREPRPAGAPIRYDRWNRVPMFLMLRATKD